MAYGSSNYRCMREQADSKSMKVRAPAMSETEEDVINDCLERSPAWRTKAVVTRRTPPPGSYGKGRWYEMPLELCERVRHEADELRDRFACNYDSYNW